MPELSEKLAQSNPNLAELDVDFLYHLGLSTADDLKGLFGDVKHVAMMGSGMRAWDFAKKLHEQTGMPIQRFSRPPEDAHKLRPLSEIRNPREADDELRNLLYSKRDLPTPIGKTERFEMYKVGDTLSISHGMGQPSHSILLHEVTKMLEYAGATGYQYYRLGTGGGIGVEGGTVVVADKGYNQTGTPTYKLHVLGEEIELPAEFDPALAKEILDCRDGIEAVIGGIMGSDDFYTEQARLDGAFCMITEGQKMTYLNRMYGLGIREFEMEAEGFAAFCQKMGIPAACICVALLNRLNGDQVTSTPSQLAAFSDNPQQMLIRYIQKKGAGARVG